MTSHTTLLDRVRKLLAKAEAEGVTPAEAEALTAKAAELMAKYGIDRALLAADRPETDQPASRIIDVPNPWARVQAHLLCGLGAAMRCQCILLPGSGPGARIHVFGYASDLERADMLYTSLLVQMWHGLAAAAMPEWCRSPRAWRRSWLLGFTTAVDRPGPRRRAGGRPPGHRADSGHELEGRLVLADRTLVIRRTPSRHIRSPARPRSPTAADRLWRRLRQGPAGRPRRTPPARRPGRRSAQASDARQHPQPALRV